MIPFGQQPVGFYMGMPVFIARPMMVPKLKLSTFVDVSDKFRDDFNEWLMDNFGFDTLNLIKDGEVITALGKVVMNQATFDTLMEKLNDK